MQQWHLARSKDDKAGRRRGRPILSNHLHPATLALQEQLQLPLRQQAVAPEEDSDLGKVLCHHTGINNKFSSTPLGRDLPMRSRFRGGTTLPCLLRHYTYSWLSQKSLC